MSASTRAVGVGGTALVMLTICALAFVRWYSVPQASAPTTLSVFDVAPPEAPPAPKTEIPPGPEQVQKEEARPEVDPPDIPPPELRVPSQNSLPLPAVQPAPEPGPPVEDTTAPEAPPLPPGARVSSAEPTWEGQILAALNRVKRYPRGAMRSKQQGVPWIRLTMDRDGHVRSVRLERSSGIASLDQEAVALPRRASPLPAPPKGVGGRTLELVLPVEFFIQ